MNFAQSHISCGVYQIFELYRNPAWLIWQFTKEAYDVHRGNNAFIIFSDVVGGRNFRGDPSGGYGERFAKYLEDKELVLNPVERSVIQVNPNSGNKIRVYLANIGNKDKLYSFVKTNFKSEPPKYAN